MSSIKEESLISPTETDLSFEHHPDYRSPSPPDSNPTSPSPPGLPLLPSAAIALPNAIRQRLDQRSTLAQQALLNRALRSRRHTLANVLRPR